MRAKKLALVCLIFCAIALPARAQSGFIQVSGTILDPQGFPYAGGATGTATISAVLVPPGVNSPTLNGNRFSTSLATTALDSEGHFLVQLADNTLVQPSGTQWKFTVFGVSGLPFPMGRGAQSFTVTETIHGNGSTQDISTDLQAAALSLTNVCPNSNITPPSPITCGNSSGGTCSLTGIPDTAELSVHPANTCFGNSDNIWDDTNEILAVGVPGISGGVSVTGAHSLYQQAYIWGGATLNCSAATAGSCGEFYGWGDNLTFTANATTSDMIGEFLIGSRLTVSNAGPGETIIGNTGGGSGASIKDDGGDNVIIGGGSISSAITGTSALGVAGNILMGGARVVGYPNSNTSVTISTNMWGNSFFSNSATTNDRSEDIFSIGDNTFTSTRDGMTSLFFFGVDNTAEDSNASGTEECVVVGEGNDINGTGSTCQEFGYENEMINVSAGNTDPNTAIFGSGNTATGVGNTTGGFAAIFGDSITLENCDHCEAVGDGFTDNGDSNQMDLGFGARQVSFSAGSVKAYIGLTAAGSTNVSGCSLASQNGGVWAGSFASGTSGTCTVTITPGTTAPNGWVCEATDLTTPADAIRQIAPLSTTVCTISGTTVSGDRITWTAFAF